MTATSICPRCAGTGTIRVKKTCYRCNGTGIYAAPAIKSYPAYRPDGRMVRVTIPGNDG